MNISTAQHSISFADAADINAVMQIMEESFDPAFGEAWNRPQCLSVLGLPGICLLLAYVGAAPAGFALTRSTGDEAELLLIGVRPQFRGMGIATSLIQNTLALANTQKIKKIFLEVRDGNPARGLYAKLGFQAVGRRRSYYRGIDGALFDAFTFALDVE